MHGISVLRLTLSLHLGFLILLPPSPSGQDHFHQVKSIPLQPLYPFPPPAMATLMIHKMLSSKPRSYRWASHLSANLLIKTIYRRLLKPANTVGPLTSASESANKHSTRSPEGLPCTSLEGPSSSQDQPDLNSLSATCTLENESTSLENLSHRKCLRSSSGSDKLMHSSYSAHDINHQMDQNPTEQQNSVNNNDFELSFPPLGVITVWS